MSAYAAAMSIGASAGFSAVTIPQLQTRDDYNATLDEYNEGFRLTNEQISWFGRT